MIFVNNKKVTEADFVTLLTATRNKTLGALRINPSAARQLEPEEFELEVYNRMVEAAKDTEFENEVEYDPGSHAFPDLVAKKLYGAEVKRTIADKWVTTGNSVQESTRVEEVDRIYLFFGKLGGNIDIKFRPYQDCLFDIGVTHSPRYKIDMGLSKGKSIFDKMGVDYDKLRKEPFIVAMKTIKEFYRSKLQPGEELWWMDAVPDESSRSLILKPFRNLSSEKQKSFLIETMILFPELFDDRMLRGNQKYDRAAAYLITKHDSYNSSFRDLFSAGGRVKISIKNKTVFIPKVLYKLFKLAKEINTQIGKIADEDLSFYWKVKKIRESKISRWKKLVNANSHWTDKGVRASDIFEAGLRT